MMDRVPEEVIMDVLKCALDSWPAAIVAIAVAGMFIFRTEIGELLKRLKTLNFPGVRASAERSQPGPHEVNPKADEPKSLPSDDDQALEYIRKHPEQVRNRLVEIAMFNDFLFIYNYIFGTQVKALLFLEEQGRYGAPLNELQRFHEEHLKLAPGNMQRSLEVYLGFMTSWELVGIQSQPAMQQKYITMKGSRFLSYLRDVFPHEYRLRIW
jgi:hypothetical protein